MVVPNFGEFNFFGNFRGSNINETNIIHNIIVYVYLVACARVCLYILAITATPESWCTVLSSLYCFPTTSVISYSVIYLPMAGDDTQRPICNSVYLNLFHVSTNFKTRRK